jgi:hypothetical protein
MRRFTTRTLVPIGLPLYFFPLYRISFLSIELMRTNSTVRNKFVKRDVINRKQLAAEASEIVEKYNTFLREIEQLDLGDVSELRPIINVSHFTYSSINIGLSPF